MPEGPEIHLSAQFVNQTCRGRIYSGKVLKSAVSRQPEIEWDEDDYMISACSRGKELKLTLQALPSKDKKTQKKVQNNGKCLDIIIQFGMSGKFDFYDASELQKHAHLNFFTKKASKDEPQMVLSFVDYRRFGKWNPGGNWSEERGPCVLTEYVPFRQNVLKNLEASAFNRPICEVLLNQKYFNGIGNYLRAEICYRGGILPFERARSVLEKLCSGEGDVKVKSENPDILQLCHILANEVINLGGTGYDPENRDPDYSKFTEWLQCYYKPDMKNIADHNNRTMWYKGPLGPLAPTNKKEKNVKRRKKKSEDNTEAKKSKLEQKTEIKEENVPVTEQKTQKRSKRKGPVTRHDVQEFEGDQNSKRKVSCSKKLTPGDKDDISAIGSSRKQRRTKQTKTEVSVNNPARKSRKTEAKTKVLQPRSKQRATSQVRKTRSTRNK